jgi:hypothetical protein
LFDDGVHGLGLYSRVGGGGGAGLPRFARNDE